MTRAMRGLTLRNVRGRRFHVLPGQLSARKTDVDGDVSRPRSIFHIDMSGVAQCLYRSKDTVVHAGARICGTRLRSTEEEFETGMHIADISDYVNAATSEASGKSQSFSSIIWVRGERGVS